MMWSKYLWCRKFISSAPNETLIWEVSSTPCCRKRSPLDLEIEQLPFSCLCCLGAPLLHSPTQQDLPQIEFKFFHHGTATTGRVQRNWKDSKDYSREIVDAPIHLNIHLQDSWHFVQNTNSKLIPRANLSMLENCTHFPGQDLCTSSLMCHCSFLHSWEGKEILSLQKDDNSAAQLRWQVEVFQVASWKMSKSTPAWRFQLFKGQIREPSCCTQVPMKQRWNILKRQTKPVPHRLSPKMHRLGEQCHFSGKIPEIGQRWGGVSKLRKGLNNFGRI